MNNNNYLIIDAQTLETVLDSLTWEEAQDICDKYPTEYLLQNAQYYEVLG